MRVHSQGISVCLRHAACITARVLVHLLVEANVHLYGPGGRNVHSHEQSKAEEAEDYGIDK
jgi:hypothetical protein